MLSREFEYALEAQKSDLRAFLQVKFRMGRQKYIPSADFPYHITARVHNKSCYPISMDKVWHVFNENLWLTHYLYNLQIHAFVLMPNHFHLIASTPDANLSQGMHYFMTQSAKRINLLANTCNQIHGSRFYRCLVASTHYYFHAYKYLYRNPVKATLTTKVQDYKYSTLRMRLGFSPLDLPLCNDDLLMDDIDGTLLWLNTRPKNRHWEQVKRALRMAQFAISDDNKSGRPKLLETLRF